MTSDIAERNFHFWTLQNERRWSTVESILRNQADFEAALINRNKQKLKFVFNVIFSIASEIYVGQTHTAGWKSHGIQWCNILFMLLQAGSRKHPKKMTDIIFQALA